VGADPAVVAHLDLVVELDVVLDHGVVEGAPVDRNCRIGGAAMISGHIEICDNAVIAGGAQVGSSITVPGVYISAIPALPFAKWRQMVSAIRRLPGLESRLRRLEGAGPGAGPADRPDSGEQEG